MTRRVECYIELVDGVPVRVRGTGPLTDRDRDALAELVRAARAHVEAQGPLHQADMHRCSCGRRHCIECGEVWPCTTVSERRAAAAAESQR